MLGFLKQSRSIRENMEVCIAKPINQNVDVYAGDLPCELSEIRQKVENKPALDTLLAVKNEIIWKLMEARPGAAGIDNTT